MKFFCGEPWECETLLDESEVTESIEDDGVDERIVGFASDVL